MTVQTSGSSGGGGKGASLTDAQLATLMQNSLIGPAILKGNRISVKVRCPKKVGATCRIALQGLLKKGKPATSTRRFKVRAGKVKRVVLKVKPRAKAKLATRKRLLFKEKVRAGGAKATVYKRLKLVRR